MNGEQQPEEVEWEIRYMYYLYYWAGGSLVSQDVSRRFRLIHITYDMVVFLICALAVPLYEYYVIKYENKSIDVIECFETVITVTIITTPIIFSLIVRYFHVEIETTLKYLANRHRRRNVETVLRCERLGSSMTEYSELASSNADIISSSARILRACESDSRSSFGIQGLRRLRAVKFAGRLHAFLYISGTFQQLIPFIYVVFFYDGVPRLLSHHVVPIPFYDRVQSRTLYYTIVTGEMISAAIILVFGSVVVTNPSMIVASMRNIFYDYCVKVRRVSDSITNYCEKNLLLFGNVRLEENIDATTLDESARRCMTELFDKIEKDLSSLIEEYIEFTKIVRTIRIYINWVSTLIVMGLWLINFENIFLILGTPTGNIVKVRHVTLAMAAIMSCVMICYNGKLLDDMNEAIIYEVYNFPWYYMPPKTRKIVNNFQSMVQKPSKFHIFVIYPLTMALFPKTMNGIYSCFNLINAAMNKRKLRES